MRTSIETKRGIEADPGRILQVLLNLTGNALDALEEEGGGVLTLRAQDAGRKAVALIVEDSGKGIPEEIREEIFEPFFTTKRPGKGTGLGLHLVKEIVTSYGGSIHVEGRSGRGTRFRVEFPTERAPNSEGSHADRGKADGAGRGRRGHDSQGVGEDVAARTL